MMPLVWLVGTSGVGKSTVGWELQKVFQNRAFPAAFIDTDQLRNVAGISSTADDLIADGIPAVLPNFLDAGARVLILSALVDDEAHLARLVPELVREQSFVVYLKANDAAVIERVERRGWNVESASNSVDYARGYDVAWVDLVVDTTDLSALEVARDLQERLSGSLAGSDIAILADRNVLEPAPSSVVLITGPGGVGLSSVGFMAFRQRIPSGNPVGYIDSHQLGFAGEDPRSPEAARLKSRNTNAIASVMHRLGVFEVLVTADPTTARLLTDDAIVERAYWLDASASTIQARLDSRAAGESPPLVGDHRVGLSGSRLRESVSASVLESRDRDLRPLHAIVIGTDEMSPSEVALQIKPRTARLDSEQ